MSFMNGILLRSIDRRNFNSKILAAEYVIPTEEKRVGLKNRHPDLYRFNKQLTQNSFNLNISITMKDGHKVGPRLKLLQFLIEKKYNRSRILSKISDIEDL